MTEQLTAQEWFDKTVGHLRTMPGQAFFALGDCVYLTPDGNKCAIGIHIPDGHPGQHEEGDVGNLVDCFPDLATVILPAGMPFSLALDLARWTQDLHDSWYSWSGDGRFAGEARLAAVAEKFDLVYSPPT